MELARAIKTGIDIATEREVLSYTYEGAAPIEVLARVDLGDNSAPIAGNGDYTLIIYLDDVPVSPSSAIAVAAGQARTIMVSRAVPLEPGDAVRITVLGRPADTSVNAVATLRDATPAKAEDLVGGGAVEIDHNYGGTDNLRLVNPAGAGIDDVNIQVYLRSDYLAGNRSNAYVIARTTTAVGGRWARSVMLDPGDYVLLCHKQAAYGPNRFDLTVE